MPTGLFILLRIGQMLDYPWDRACYPGKGRTPIDKARKHTHSLD